MCLPNLVFLYKNEQLLQLSDRLIMLTSLLILQAFNTNILLQLLIPKRDTIKLTHESEVWAAFQDSE